MAQLPVPAQELSPPLPFPLHVLSPRQTCLSCSSSAGSFFSFSAAFAASWVPSRTPPKAAMVSFPKSRRDNWLSWFISRFCIWIGLVDLSADDLAHIKAGVGGVKTAPVRPETGQ